MRHVSTGKSISAVGSILVLLIAFVAYRARTFNYCAGYEARDSHFSIVAGDQVCGAAEQSMAFGNLWRAEGFPAKFKMIGQTVAHAFVP